MAKKLNNSELQYDASAKVGGNGSAVLGKLSGPIADIVNPTRNGRKYSEELWEKTFNDPIVKEYFNCGGLFGEMNHPEDREETDLTKVCICMPQPPTKKDGKLWGEFDILDTPNGRILKTLCDYGYRIGVSSRGSGDLITDYDGCESVDPNTYTLQGWDIVLLPAVEAARMDYMTESYKGKSLRTALNEALNKANAADKQIMKETLHNLKLDVVDESIDSNSNNKSKANNAGVDMIKELQESLKREKQLRLELSKIQEQVSVSYAKETKCNEELAKYKNAVAALSETAKQTKVLQSQLDSLKEEVKTKDKLLQEKETKFKELVENQKTVLTAKKSLNENYSKLKNSLERKDSEISKLKEQLENIKGNSQVESHKLIEKYESEKKDYQIKNNELTAKLESAKKLIEKFKSTASNAVSRYIDSKATMLGVSSNEIKNKLPENYSFNDIDRICEELQDYQLNISSLPFNVTNKKPQIKVNVKESKETIKPAGRYDDEVDEQLLRLANLN